MFPAFAPLHVQSRAAAFYETKPLSDTRYLIGCQKSFKCLLVVDGPKPYLEAASSIDDAFHYAEFVLTMYQKYVHFKSPLTPSNLDEAVPWRDAQELYC